MSNVNKISRIIIAFAIFIIAISISGCKMFCIHEWKFDTESNKKECMKCGAVEDFIPSGYYLDARTIEHTSQTESFYNDVKIACTSTEEASKKLTTEDEKELLVTGELFYVPPGESCEILSETHRPNSPINIVITSGEYNGQICWTDSGVVVNDKKIKEYEDKIKEEERQREAEIRNVATQAAKSIKEIGVPIYTKESGRLLFSNEKFNALQEVFEELYRYREDSECAELLMSKELFLNRLLGSTEEGEDSIFESEKTTNIMGLEVAKSVSISIASKSELSDYLTISVYVNTLSQENPYGVYKEVNTYDDEYNLGVEHFLSVDGGETEKTNFIKIVFIDIDTIEVTFEDTTFVATRSEPIIFNDDFSSAFSSDSGEAVYIPVSLDDEQYWYAVTAAQSLVEEKLKSPSTAEFPLEGYTVERSNNNWRVSGYVDAQNGFGATIREYWTATFEMGDNIGGKYKISNYSVFFE